MGLRREDRDPFRRGEGFRIIRIRLLPRPNAPLLGIPQSTGLLRLLHSNIVPASRSPRIPAGSGLEEDA